MMVGSHAQIVNVDRVEGVPYMVLPSSGKSPYGTPDRGGFTGWVRYGVAEDITADVRAFAQSVTVTGPDALAAGSSATLGGELVQPNGVATGTRRVPLRYPMSVRWTGSESLQVGGSVDDARRSGKVAVLNTTTRELTAVRAGAVTVTAEADSMRDGDDLSADHGLQDDRRRAVRGAAGRGRRRRHGAARRSPSRSARAPSVRHVPGGRGPHLHGVDRRDRHVDRG